MLQRTIGVDERLPLLQTLPLSLQHLFAMFGATVLVPFLFKVNPATCLLMNGVGMIGLIVLILARHWAAPWWMGTLGVGLIIWILVQLAIMPETSWLQWFFLFSGLVLGFVALFWLRRTGQLKLW